MYCGHLPTLKPFKSKSGSEQQQYLLVKLLRVAEYWNWAELFNAAMSTYLKALNDTDSNIMTEHIKLLSDDSTPRPICNKLSKDYAFYLCKVSEINPCEDTSGKYLMKKSNRAGEVVNPKREAPALVSSNTSTLTPSGQTMSASNFSVASQAFQSAPSSRISSFPKINQAVSHRLNNRFTRGGTETPRFTPLNVSMSFPQGLNTIDVMQSISCMPQYVFLSFEELRLEDYSLGRRYGELNLKNPTFSTPFPETVFTRGINSDHTRTASGSSLPSYLGTGASTFFNFENPSTTGSVWGSGPFSKSFNSQFNGLFGNGNSTSNAQSSNVFGSIKIGNNPRPSSVFGPSLTNHPQPNLVGNNVTGNSLQSTGLFGSSKSTSISSHFDPLGVSSNTQNNDLFGTTLQPNSTLFAKSSHTSNNHQSSGSSSTKETVNPSGNIKTTFGLVEKGAANPWANLNVTFAPVTEGVTNPGANLNTTFAPVKGGVGVFGALENATNSSCFSSVSNNSFLGTQVADKVGNRESNNVSNDSHLAVEKKQEQTTTVSATTPAFPPPDLPNVSLANETARASDIIDTSSNSVQYSSENGSQFRTTEPGMKRKEPPEEDSTDGNEVKKVKVEEEEDDGDDNDGSSTSTVEIKTSPTPTTTSSPSPFAFHPSIVDAFKLSNNKKSCRFYAKGHCKYGVACRFTHTTD